MLVLMLMTMVVTVSGYQNVTVDQQLVMFKDKTWGPIGVMTTSAGAPVEYKDATEAINSDLISNEFFMDAITHLTHERIPERVVHAKGAGAFGYFEVTNDITSICSAKLFSSVGKKTPVAVRFSPVFVGSGGADTTRETRGFAVKFYTEDGNFDLLGLNAEMFLIKDPLFFPTFIHAFKRNPQTYTTPDANMIWDFLTLRPETLNMFLLVFGDSGIPDGYRYLPGFAIHTYELVNERGEKSYVKFHILPDAGIRTLNSTEGMRIAGEDPDYATKDLYTAIANGNNPTWTLSIQVIDIHEVKAAKFDVFDITKKWPLDEYPLKPVGRLVLNKNPNNYFAEVEQLAFCPGNLVPGIIGGVDQIFKARRFAYRDAQNYRLGINFNKIQVNCPLRALTYNRDGHPPVRDNEKGTPNYYPNSFNGPVPYLDMKKTNILEVYTDPDANNFDQAGYLYAHEMSESERGRLVENIVTSLKYAEKFLQERAVKIYNIIHEDLADRVAYGLWANDTAYEDHL